jgi:excisionase family DNA binding protein
MRYGNTGWEPPEVLDLVDAARFLRCSTRHLWTLARAGKVPHQKLGTLYRFSRDELTRFLSPKPSKEGGDE